MNKWFLIALGIFLIAVGLLTIPWITLMGMAAYLYQFITSLTLYTTTEILFIIIIFFASVLMLIAKLRR
jgi:hypothetical protein